jgi:hypothetical protein
MFQYIVGAILFAWMLTWFGFDNFILGVINSFFGTRFDINAYYISAIILAILDRW